MAEEFERVKRELIHKGNIIDLFADYVKLPDGKIVKWDFIKHNGAAAIIPVTNNGEILMVKQYRNAIDRYTLEIPAGGLDTIDEPMIACAKRELEEETGFKSENLKFLISLRTTVAFCDERIDIYVATNLIPSRQNLDEDEYVDVEAYTIDELCNMIFEGKIQDAKTISALLAFHTKYC